MESTASGRGAGVNMAAAVTRSLLGWGVVAGILYLAVGVALGVTRDGFDFARHALSQLMLGDLGWAQVVNLGLGGVLTIVAAIGFGRAMRGAAGAGAARTLLVIFGGCLVASAVFPPDPMAGFPPGSPSEEGSLGGVLHLAFGTIGFGCLAAAAIVVGTWSARRQEPMRAGYSRGSGVVIAIGFVGGGALSTETLGVVLLWIAVVAGWAWLAVTSVYLYRIVPHPDADRRDAAEA